MGRQTESRQRQRQAETQFESHTTCPRQRRQPAKGVFSPVSDPDCIFLPRPRDVDGYDAENPDHSERAVSRRKARPHWQVGCVWLFFSLRTHFGSQGRSLEAGEGPPHFQARIVAGSDARHTVCKDSESEQSQESTRITLTQTSGSFFPLSALPRHRCHHILQKDSLFVFDHRDRLTLGRRQSARPEVS